VFIQSLHQAKRLFRILLGFTLLATGVLMLVTPGPGLLILALGLALLAVEFVWARRILNQLKVQGVKVRNGLIGNRPSAPH